MLTRSHTRGADKAYLLSDRAFAGADTLATSHTLSLAIKKIVSEGDKDENYLVICGNEATRATGFKQFAALYHIGEVLSF